MSTIDPREHKLPKWAQSELASLRQRVQAAESERNAARLATDPDRTNTVIDRYGRIPIGLPHGERVRYKLGLDDMRAWVDVHAEGNRIEIMGGDMLSVSPRSGNVVWVEVVR